MTILSAVSTLDGGQGMILMDHDDISSFHGSLKFYFNGTFNQDFKCLSSANSHLEAVLAVYQART